MNREFSIGTSFFLEHSLLSVETLSCFPVNFIKHRGPLATLGRRGLREMTADEPKTPEDENQCFWIQTQLQTPMTSVSERSKLINEHPYNRTHPVCQFGEASPRHASKLFNHKVSAGLVLPTKTIGGKKSERRINFSRFTRNLDFVALFEDLQENLVCIRCFEWALPCKPCCREHSSYSFVEPSQFPGRRSLSPRTVRRERRPRFLKKP